MICLNVLLASMVFEKLQICCSNAMFVRLRCNEKGRHSNKKRKRIAPGLPALKVERVRGTSVSWQIGNLAAAEVGNWSRLEFPTNLGNKAAPLA